MSNEHVAWGSPDDIHKNRLSVYTEAFAAQPAVIYAFNYMIIGVHLYNAGVKWLGAEPERGFLPDFSSADIV